MTQLEKFRPEHAREILSWPTSQQEAFYWASLSGYDAFDTSVFSSWHADSDVFAYVLTRNNLLCACGELWLEPSENSVEIARLIVAPDFRRQGVAKALIQELTTVAKDKGFVKSWLRVFPENKNAVSCYLACGFHYASDDETNAFNALQARSYVWLGRDNL